MKKAVSDAFRSGFAYSSDPAHDIVNLRLFFEAGGENDGEQHFEILHGIDGVRDFRRHDERLARMDDMLCAAHGEAAHAFEHLNERIADRVVRADLLALGKSEEREAYGAVLRQCFGNDLAVLG